MREMKSTTIITAALCFLLISVLRSEDQPTNNTQGVDNSANTSNMSDVSEQNETSENLDSVLPLGINPEELKQKYLSKQANEKEWDSDEENQEEIDEDNEENEEEKEHLESEEDTEESENDEEEEYADENEDEYWQRKQHMEMEHLNHQANLFDSLNLNDRFNDLSVSLEEEIEDMIRVLGEDDQYPLREVPFSNFEKRDSQNTTIQHPSPQKTDEYGPIEHLSDDYSDMDEPNPFFHRHSFK